MKKLFLLSLPLAILFAYAGLVKGLDVSLFQAQLGKSPLIPTATVPAVSYAVPVIELLVAVGLFSDRYFKWAVYASLALMAFFTMYLTALVALFPKESIPCSCGGVLGQLGYPVHIAFNAGFTLLAAYLCLQTEALPRVRPNRPGHAHA